MKKRILTLALAGTLALTGCSDKNQENTTEETANQVQSEEEKDTETQDTSSEYITKINYSNMLDEESQKEVEESLINAGISEENAQNFLNDVKKYNEIYEDVLLAKDGFKESESLDPIYDFDKIDTIRNESEDNIIDSNCRMTSFQLMKDLLDIDTNNTEVSNKLFMDTEAIDLKMDTPFTKEDKIKFYSLYPSIKTELVKDINVHQEKIQDYAKNKNLSFKDSKAKLITLWFHDDIDNELFVGHVGVLVPNKNDDSLLFVEKISFSDPYQAIKFQNKQELNDYLMGKYDVSYGQPTAKPFIMENDKLLEEYRENPNNKELSNE